MFMPYIIKTGDITTRHLSYFEKIKEEISETDSNLNCHQISELMEKRRPETFKWIKGRFNNFDHSWIIFKNSPKVIIDCYPWCVASGPILLSLEGLMWRNLYVEENEWLMMQKSL